MPIPLRANENFLSTLLSNLRAFFDSVSQGGVHYKMANSAYANDIAVDYTHMKLEPGDLPSLVLRSERTPNL